MTWQRAPILYPSAEKVLVAALKAALVARGRSDVSVDRAVTTRRPLVVLTRDGGAAGTLRDRPRMRLRVFETSVERADDLARLVTALAMDLPGGNGITHAEILSGPYEVPDESGPLRYALLEFHIRGEVL